MVSLKQQFEEAKKKYKLPKASSHLSAEKETGFFKTKKVRCQACKQGFIYRYRWFDEKEDKYRVLSSIDIKKLREKVIAKNLSWKVENNYKAKNTAKEMGLSLNDLK